MPKNTKFLLIICIRQLNEKKKNAIFDRIVFNPDLSIRDYALSQNYQVHENV